MRLFAAATGALAALTLMGSAPAIAADLGYGYPLTDRYKSAYEDKRYRDIFGPPPHTARAPYVEEDDDIVDHDVDHDRQRIGTYHDREVYDDKRIITRRRYSYAEPAAPACAPRAEIRHRLLSEGWHDFAELDVRHRVAIVEARRPNGLPYRLKIDRCSGDIVSAEPLAPVPYAYRPRRFGPYYR
jgi:hypothetical protein